MDNLHEEIKQLRRATAEELCNLRRDVDVLQRGGWEVKIGAFQALVEPNHSGTQAIQERLLGLKLATDDSVQGTVNGATQEQDVPINGNFGMGPNRDSRKSASSFKMFPSPDEPVPSIEDPATSAKLSFAPLVIRQSSPLLAELAEGVPAADQTRTFSNRFIHTLLGGSEWSPGFYYISPSAGECVLRSRSYYVLDATVDPFLPAAPGSHGAKLVPFVRDSIADDDPEEIATKDVPVFVKCSKFAASAGGPNDEYVYFGNYSQLRFSDRLDYDRMVSVVPNEVKMFWAEQLVDPGRPNWMTEALMSHFENKPEFRGEPTSSRVGQYMKDLEDWELHAIAKVDELTKEDVLKAFASADCDYPKGLRLWWEYLQCVGYDDKFYKALVKKQDAWRKQ